MVPAARPNPLWPLKGSTGVIAKAISMSYRYRLIDEEGNDLGLLASRRARWPVGERVSRWHGEEFEVVNFVAANDGDCFDGYVVVASISAPSAALGETSQTG